MKVLNSDSTRPLQYGQFAYSDHRISYLLNGWQICVYRWRVSPEVVVAVGLI